MSEKDVLIKGAFIIALGGFIAKLLGAIYRIPLTNILGSDGIGIYQLVFPLYSLLLTVSSTGIPQSLSKLISERITLGQTDKAKGVLKASLLMFGSIGLIGSVLMALFSGLVSKLQGEPLAFTAYLLISPSVFLVSIISCIRGYFQGRMNMVPTGSSQVLEQLVKLSLGLSLALLFKDNIVKAASLSCLAVTVSEVIAVIFLGILLKKSLKKEKTKSVTENEVYKKILKITLPVTLSAILIPVSQLVDSFLIINIIGKYSDNATSLYGLFTGGVMTIIGLPVCICYGIAAAVIPIIAKHYALKEFDRAEKKVMLSIKYTLFIAIPSFLFCLFFPQKITHIIFGGIEAEEIKIMAKILIYASPAILFLPMVQTLSACLIAKNKQLIPAISMLAGITIKIIIEIILLNNPKISINGGAISASVCYLVAAVINLVYIIRDKKNYIAILKQTIIFALLTFLSLAFANFIIKLINGTIGFLIGGLAFLLIYIALIIIFKVFKNEEINFFKKRSNK
jgi:stage V sporulation protein B